MCTDDVGCQLNEKIADKQRKKRRLPAEEEEGFQMKKKAT